MPWNSLHARGRAYLPRRHAFAAIAQLGERQTEDLKVPGSIPGGGTALVAQLVEHGSNKPRVGGSSPSWSTLLLFFCNHGVFYGCARREHPFRSYSVMVITKDSESFDPGSSPGRTCSFFPGNRADSRFRTWSAALFPSLWPNWIRRLTTNQKIGGSSPSRDIFYFFSNPRGCAAEQLYNAAARCSPL